MLSDAEAIERRRLADRHFSPDPGHRLAEDELSRLRYLEDRRTQATEEPSVSPSVSPYENAAAPGTPVVVDAAPPHRRIALTATAALVLGLTVGGLAISAVAGATGQMENAIPPELLRAATDEDLANVDTDDVDVDPATARFIASMEGMDIYLATNAEQSLMCILAGRDGTVKSSGCGSWPNGDGAFATAVSDDLTIVLGDPDSLDIPGTRLQLTESVTAVRKAARNRDAPKGAV